MDEGMRANEGKDRFFNPCQVDTQRDLGDEQKCDCPRTYTEAGELLTTKCQKTVFECLGVDNLICPFPCPNNDCRDCK